MSVRIDRIIMGIETQTNFNAVEGSSSLETTSPKTQNVFERNGGSFLTFTVVFLIVLQVYNRKGGKGSKKGSKGEDGEEYLGYDDLPAVKPWIPLNIIGNVPQLLPFKSSLKTAEKWSDEYKDIFTLVGMNQKFVVFNSGSTIQALLKSSDFGHLIKSPIIYDAMKPFVTNGVLVSKGKFWQHERKILLKSQTFQSLKAYIGMLNRHSVIMIQDFEKLFEDGKPHEINELINVTFLGVISEMITGKPMDRSTELTTYHHNFNIWKEVVMSRIINPLLLFKPIWVFHPKSKIYDQAVKELSDFARKRIKEARDDRAAAQKKIEKNSCDIKISDPPTSEFRSVLDELLDAGVDDDQMVDEVNTMIFGGHETGASTIHCLLFALALNPKIQAEARREVDELFENPNCFKNGRITYESVQTDLKYVERCIFEALRIFPPVFVSARCLNAPLRFVTFEEFKGKTVKLPIGINCLVSPYLIHRREDLYPEPHKFDPDRFIPEEAATRHAYSFIPFSAGPRNCLGLKFAMIEMKIVTAYILRHFELTTTDTFEGVPLLPLTTLTPEKDFTFQFKRRAL